GPLDPKVERVVSLLSAGLERLPEVSILWAGRQELSDRNRPQVAKLARELLRRQVLVERIRHGNRDRSLVLVDDPRIHLVQVISVVQIVAEVGETRQFDDDTVRQLARNTEIKAVVHGTAVIATAPTDVGRTESDN